MRGVITLTYQQALGLREAMRPLASPPTAPIDPVVLLLFHERVLLMLVAFETTPGMTKGEMALIRDECLLISQFLSMQDGDWAADVLKQARRALHEVRTGVLPAFTQDMAHVWEGTTTEKHGDSVPADDSGAA